MSVEYNKFFINVVYIMYTCTYIAPVEEKKKDCGALDCSDVDLRTAILCTSIVIH